MTLLLCWLGVAWRGATGRGNLTAFTRSPGLAPVIKPLLTTLPILGPQTTALAGRYNATVAGLEVRIPLPCGPPFCTTITEGFPDDGCLALTVLMTPGKLGFMTL